jgi:hypothetical protein
MARMTSARLLSSGLIESTSFWISGSFISPSRSIRSRSSAFVFFESALTCFCAASFAIASRIRPTAWSSRPSNIFWISSGVFGVLPPVMLSNFASSSGVRRALSASTHFEASIPEASRSTRVSCIGVRLVATPRIPMYSPGSIALASTLSSAGPPALTSSTPRMCARPRRPSSARCQRRHGGTGRNRP